MAGKVITVVGGQFGSEGKGAVVTWLAKKVERPFVIRIGGPNAGHTAYAGKKAWKLRTIPVGALVPGALLGIARSSEIEESILDAEVRAFEDDGIEIRSRLFIDAQASVLNELHHEIERENGMHERLGSTAKGIGACRSARIMRTAKIWRDLYPDAPNVRDLAVAHLHDGGTVIIETSQGFGLGLHEGFYPKCTSADCTSVDAFAAVGLCPWAPYVAEIEPWVVLRTFPIRVAGDSGPLYRERTWEELELMSNGHIQPERTTVTNKVRRVGSWDGDLARRAVEANGGPRAKVVLTFADYLYPGSANTKFKNELPTSALEMFAGIGHEIGARVCAVGTGPATIVDLDVEEFARYAS